MPVCCPWCRVPFQHGGLYPISRTWSVGPSQVQHQGNTRFYVGISTYGVILLFSKCILLMMWSCNDAELDQFIKRTDGGMSRCDNSLNHHRYAAAPVTYVPPCNSAVQWQKHWNPFGRTRLKGSGLVSRLVRHVDWCIIDALSVLCSSADNETGLRLTLKSFLDLRLNYFLWDG